jgi:hypothetical protein
MRAPFVSSEGAYANAKDGWKTLRGGGKSEMTMRLMQVVYH